MALETAPIAEVMLVDAVVSDGIPVIGRTLIDGAWVHMLRDTGDVRSYPASGVIEIDWVEAAIATADD